MTESGRHQVNPIAHAASAPRTVVGEIVDMQSTAETWADFVWPEWVPLEQRRRIESFWSEANGRGHQEWIRQHVIQRVPPSGTVLRLQLDKYGWANLYFEVAQGGVVGRYLHCWNNIGRIITEKGEVIYASGSLDGAWRG